MTAEAVQTLLDDIRLLGADQLAMVEAVRALVAQTFPSAREQVKYGGILFSSGMQFCGVFAYRQHVSVEFSYGATITDGPGHLEGTGRGRRHLKLRSVQDIRTKNLAHYLPLAWQAADAAT